MTSYYRELDKQTLMRERLTEEIMQEIIINLISSGYNDETMHAATKLPMKEIAEFRAKYESEVEFYDKLL